MLEIGSIIAGKLRVESVLGRGGMGTVVLATHLQLDQRVVVKVLHDELLTDMDTVARFMREGRASAKLRSEHICHVSDVGQLESGAPYLVMELLEGRDLAQVIAAQPLDVATASEYVLQACVAIAEAHAAGIIHRDLKPANLFVTRRLDGSALVKVLDFGIAKATSPGDFKITQTTMVMGSPGYMSPEHLRSARDVDARSDIWALGVILYEAVSGRLPFPGSSITELAVKIVIDQPAPLDADPRYVAIVARCLEKQPEARYPSVTELAADLAAIAGGDAQRLSLLVARISAGQTAAIPAPTAPLVAAGSTTLQTAAGHTVAPVPRPRRALALVVVALAVAAVATAAVVATRDHTEHRPIDAATLAVAPPDAGSLDAAVSDADTPDADDRRDKLRDKLEQLAEAHDWPALLEVADLGRGDPELAPIVADAKQHYLAQQLGVVEAASARGDCPRARDAAAAGAKLVPEDTTLAEKVKACAPRKPTAAPTSPLEAAKEAYDRHDFGKALELAKQAIATSPQDPDAILEAGLAACELKLPDEAKTYAAQLTGRPKTLVSFVCANNGVKLATPPPPAADAEIARDVQATRDAFKAAEYPRTIALAEAVLRRRPRNAIAAMLAGESACRMHQPRRAKEFLLLVNPLSPQAAAITRACDTAHVPLAP